LSEDRQPTPGAPSYQLCGATTRQGGACRAPATSDGLCCWHSPKYRTQRSKWAKAGAKASQFRQRAKRAAQAAALEPPSFNTVEEIKAFLQELAGKVLRGEVPPSVAGSVRSIAQTSLRVLEAELELRSLELLEEAKTPTSAFGSRRS
jgi:hypothetical protein